MQFRSSSYLFYLLPSILIWSRARPEKLPRGGSPRYPGHSSLPESENRPLILTKQKPARLEQKTTHNLTGKFVCGLQPSRTVPPPTGKLPCLDRRKQNTSSPPITKTFPPTSQTVNIYTTSTSAVLMHSKQPWNLSRSAQLVVGTSTNPHSHKLLPLTSFSSCGQGFLGSALTKSPPNAALDVFMP